MPPPLLFRVFIKQGCVISPSTEYPPDPHQIGRDREGHHHAPLKMSQPQPRANVIARHAALGERLQPLAKAADAAHVADRHLGAAIGVPYISLESGKVALGGRAKNNSTCHASGRPCRR